MGTSVFSPDGAGSNLSHIVLYEGIEDLGNLTFRGCSELKEIVIPSTVKHIGSNPFTESGITEIINRSSSFLLEGDFFISFLSSFFVSSFLFLFFVSIETFSFSISLDKISPLLIHTLIPSFP